MTPNSARPALHSARRLAAAAFGLAVMAILGACGEGTGSTCATCDTGRPTVSLAQTGTSDTSISFTTHATDNLGLLTVHARVTAAGLSGGFDTTFNTAVTAVDIPYTIDIPSSIPTGTSITVVASAMDGAHNAAHPDTLMLHTGAGGANAVIVTNPHSTDTAVVGFSLAVAISGKTTSKVKTLGYIASGVFATPFRDSVVFTSPLKDSIALDTALSLVGASTGTLTITPFMIDSLGRQTLGAPVSLFVTNVIPTNTVPVVDFSINSRIESRDTIHVEARDRSGVTWVGYEVRNLPSAGSTFFAADSVAIPPSTSSVTHTFRMNLNVTTFPTQLQVQAFARNANTRDYARTPVGNTGVIRVDTVTVVAGLTTPLQSGGLVADALYHPPTNSIYLSNIERNELDVFNLGDSTFHSPIPVGSRPWGIAAWPRDRDGTMGDTLLVANSGGTLISYVNTNSQQEVFRYPLPVLLAQSVTSTTGSNGVLTETITDYVFSDRPQYLATTCQGSLVPGSPCGNVVLVYTTTPTAGQSAPFTNDGTVRWENLQTHQSHFFFEQAMGQSADTKDTLQVQRFAAQGVGASGAIVPFRQQFITGADTSYYSIVIKVPALGFRDTTYTRNSGNFRRAVLGEGGAAGGSGSQPNSRAILYDVTQGFITTFTDKGHTYALPVPDIDAGVSGSFLVTDFIANTSTPVSGVAINFDGELAGVRADSTYLFDNSLRLQGMLQTSSGNAGIDFHPQNAGIPQPGPSGGTHLFFAASNQPQIEVYNTNFYARCLVVPTRDPVIGPIKSAPIGAGNVVLVGATAHGVVIVTVTASQLSACS